MIDSTEFNRIVLPHSHKIFAVAYRFMQQAEEAEDVVQDIFIKLWQKREELPPGDRLLPFILVMTRNLCIDRLRTRHDTERDDKIPDDISTSNPVEEKDRLQQMMKLIALLPESQREVLKLRVFRELSTEEISIKLNLSEQNVRQLLSRARRQLKELANKQGVI